MPRVALKEYCFEIIDFFILDYFRVVYRKRLMEVFSDRLRWCA
jgi:hypothetical protein